MTVLSFIFYFMPQELASNLVSIIVVTCRVRDHLDFCLDSIARQTYPCIETIVIDNSPLSGRKNLFYAAGLNQGIAAARGEFILCLNDDVILEDNFISEALLGFALSDRIGMVSGKILRFDRRTIDSSGLFLTPWYSARERGYNCRDRGQFQRPGYCFGVTGAAAFYRVKMLEELKAGEEYLDADFRMFFEDLDMAWRAQNFSWKAYYWPRAVAYHLRGASARAKGGRGRGFARRYLDAQLHCALIKNRYLCVIKNECFLRFWYRLPFALVYDILSWFYILFFRPSVLRIFLRGPIKLSEAFNKRRLLKRKARVVHGKTPC